VVQRLFFLGLSFWNGNGLFGFGLFFLILRRYSVIPMAVIMIVVVIAVSSM